MTDEIELTRSFRFEAAHRLPRVPDGHKCARVHGHSYHVDVTIVGPIGERTGWLLDFGEMDERIKPVRDTLNHSFLNEVEGLENPTAEVLARWIWHRLREALPGLCAVTVQETPNSRCTYRGPRPR